MYMTKPAAPMAEEVLQYYMERGEPYSAGEIAAQCELSQATISRRLEELYERGAVEKKPVGQTAAYWIALP